MPQNRTQNAARPRSASGMRGLLLLNGVLLAVLLAMTFGDSADAQGRARGNYIMAAGGVNGSQSAALYIADTTNQEMIAVTYSQNNKRLEGIGYRNLAYDAAARTGRN